MRLALLFVVACSAPAPAPAATPVAPHVVATDAAPVDTSSADAQESAAARDARIQATFGTRCKFERACGSLWGIDCQSAVDGPYVYVKPADLQVVSTCGGACMGGRCTNCPPHEWTCPTY